MLPGGRGGPLLWLCVMLAGLGCKSKEPSTTRQPAVPRVEPLPSTLKLEHLTDMVTDPTFELRLTPGGPYKAGELAHFVVSLTPKGEYHVNQEYPMEVAVHGPVELTFPKTSLAKEDAAAFNDRVARFDVPVTPTSAGEHRVIADVGFAVCTDETCVPDQRKLALVLDVE